MANVSFMPPKIVLATSNAGKIREFTTGTSLVLPFELVLQSDFGVGSVEETGLSFIENALLKARHAAKATGLPAIADDSGLIIDALGGAPGLYSARYAGEHASREQRIAKVLTALEGVPATQRSARFYCTLVYLSRWDDPLPIITEGVWEGQILFAPQGTQGFGYEPIFYIPEYQCSAAEIPLTEKMRLSHRGKCWQALLQRLSCLSL